MDKSKKFDPDGRIKVKSVDGSIIETYGTVSYMTNNYFMQLNVSKFGLLALPPTPSLASRTKGGDV